MKRILLLLIVLCVLFPATLSGQTLGQGNSPSTPSTSVNIRGSSDLEFTAPTLTATRDVTITNTQYGLAGGVTFGLVF